VCIGFRSTFARREALFGRRAEDEDDNDTATILNNLASLYRPQGKLAEAEPLYRRSLAITEKKLGPKDPQTATVPNYLAELYTSQSR
jgi:hypothetical protein